MIDKLFLVKIYLSFKYRRCLRKEILLQRCQLLQQSVLKMLLKTFTFIIRLLATRSLDFQRRDQSASKSFRVQ